MLIKTTDDVWNDWRKYYLKSKSIRKKYIDNKWIAVGDLEKLLTERIREEKRKKRTPHRLGIIRALSFVRRIITKKIRKKQ